MCSEIDDHHRRHQKLRFVMIKKNKYETKHQSLSSSGQSVDTAVSTNSSICHLQRLEG